MISFTPFSSAHRRTRSFRSSLPTEIAVLPFHCFTPVSRIEQRKNTTGFRVKVIEKSQCPGRQVVGQVKKVGKSRNFHQKVGKSRIFFAKK